MKTPRLTIAAAPAADIPGLVLRPYAGEADIPHVVRIQNAEWAADGTRGHMTADEYVAWWGHANEKFDPARDVRLAELDGQVVAFGQSDWVDTTDGLREYRSSGAVDPEFRRRGIGSVMLADRMAAARSLDATYTDVDRPTPARHVGRSAQRRGLRAGGALRLRAGAMVLRHGALDHR